MRLFREPKFVEFLDARATEPVPGMPDAARERVVAAARRIAADPEFIGACRGNGFSLHWRFDRDFAAYMAQDDAQFGEVIALLEGGT